MFAWHSVIFVTATSTCALCAFRQLQQFSYQVYRCRYFIYLHCWFWVCYFISSVWSRVMVTVYHNRKMHLTSDRLANPIGLHYYVSPGSLSLPNFTGSVCPEASRFHIPFRLLGYRWSALFPWDLFWNQPVTEIVIA